MKKLNIYQLTALYLLMILPINILAEGFKVKDLTVEGRNGSINNKGDLFLGFCNQESNRLCLSNLATGSSSILTEYDSIIATYNLNSKPRDVFYTAISENGATALGYHDQEQEVFYIFSRTTTGAIYQTVIDKRSIDFNIPNFMINDQSQTIAMISYDSYEDNSTYLRIMITNSAGNQIYDSTEDLGEISSYYCNFAESNSKDILVAGCPNTWYLIENQNVYKINTVELNLQYDAILYSINDQKEVLVGNYNYSSDKQEAQLYKIIDNNYLNPQDPLRKFNRISNLDDYAFYPKINNAAEILFSSNSKTFLWSKGRKHLADCFLKHKFSKGFASSTLNNDKSFIYQKKNKFFKLKFNPRKRYKNYCLEAEVSVRDHCRSYFDGLQQTSPFPYSNLLCKFNLQLRDQNGDIPTSLLNIDAAPNGNEDLSDLQGKASVYIKFPYTFQDRDYSFDISDPEDSYHPLELDLKPY